MKYIMSIFLIFLISLNLVLGLEEIEAVNFELNNLISLLSESNACELIKDEMESELVGFTLPKQIPFTNEVFVIFIDSNFIGNVKLENKEVTSFDCSSEIKSNFEVHLSSSIFTEEQMELLKESPVDYYLNNKKDGNIKIKANGFVRGIKLGFINFGVKIASFFI
ncbi:MAG: hypothetical protein WC260_02345 [Candidatus Pacearchaeota archaeon]